MLVAVLQLSFLLAFCYDMSFTAPSPQAGFEAVPPALGQKVDIPHKTHALRMSRLTC